MRYRYVYLFCLVAFAGVIISCGRDAGSTGKSVASHYITDYSLSGWNMPEFENPDCVRIEGSTAGSENTMAVFSRWNEDSLCFFFRVEDTDLRAYQTERDHPQLWLDDMVEILIDTQNNKDSCWAEDDIVYHINILEYVKDDRGSRECATNPAWNGKARFRVQLFGTVNDTTDVDQGYLLTLSFPWEEIGPVPSRNLTMGVNFANGDNDGRGRQLFDWVGASPMRSPYAFGNLVLKKKGLF